MSPLRSRFVDSLELRGFTKATVRNYVQAVKQFSQWLGRSPLKMTSDNVREYLIYLKQKKRVAIGNRRIVAADHNTVTFRYRDYADNDTRKLMTVNLVEFIRRFMLHVLPAGFRRIRYYGFLACAARKKRFARCREFFRIPKTKAKKGARTCVQIIKELTGFDPLKCPVCKQGTLITIALVPKLPPGMAPA